MQAAVRDVIRVIKFIISSDEKAHDLKSMARLRVKAEKAVANELGISKPGVQEKYTRTMGFEGENRIDKLDEALLALVANGKPTPARVREFTDFLNTNRKMSPEQLARMNRELIGGEQPGETTEVLEPQKEAHAKGLQDWLSKCCNVVLEGVPGTGKTHAIEELVSNRGLGRFEGTVVRFMTMHPSTSYEDFVEGLRPVGRWENSTSNARVSRDGSDSSATEPWFHRPYGADDTSKAPAAGFAVKNGFFIEACVEAVKEPRKAIVVVLDELNRCNIPKVLGDLMTVIEDSKRVKCTDKQVWQVDSATKAVTLPYSGRVLFVPDNLFIVGTMNTTDRSVAPMDAALRRRFSFHRIWPQGFGPDESSRDEEKKQLLEQLGKSKHVTASLELWSDINRVLEARYGADAMLGHSFLYDLKNAIERPGADADSVIKYHWDHRILPQVMDAIVSNGLTRLFTSNPAAFFTSSSTDKRTKELEDETSDIFGGRIRVTLTGKGSHRVGHLSLGEIFLSPESSAGGSANTDDKSNGGSQQ